MKFQRTVTPTDNLSLKIPAGAWISWLARSGEGLIVCNRAENLELVVALLENSLADFEVLQIVLPTVQFQDATLTEAVEFLRIKSRELDPGKKGLNVLVKPGGDPKAAITMQFKNVPASEALRYVASLARCSLTVVKRPHGILDKESGPMAATKPKQ